MDINIEEYYSRYGPMVLRRCRQLLKDEERAMDAMQEVFVKLMKYRSRLKGTYPSSLLYRIATNTCLNMIRDHRPHQSLEDHALLGTMGACDTREEEIIARSVLSRVFRDEKESTRDIAVMHYVDGMTLQDVADTVGMSLSGVRKRIRVLKAKVQLNKEEYYGT